VSWRSARFQRIFVAKIEQLARGCADEWSKDEVLVTTHSVLVAMFWLSVSVALISLGSLAWITARRRRPLARPAGQDAPTASTQDESPPRVADAGATRAAPARMREPAAIREPSPTRDVTESLGAVEEPRTLPLLGAWPGVWDAAAVEWLGASGERVVEDPPPARDSVLLRRKADDAQSAHLNAIGQRAIAFIADVAVHDAREGGRVELRLTVIPQRGDAYEASAFVAAHAAHFRSGDPIGIVYDPQRPQQVALDRAWVPTRVG
jgi:hypothetical protein